MSAKFPDNIPSGLSPAQRLRRIHDALVFVDGMGPGHQVDEHDAIPDCYIMQLAQWEELQELIYLLERA